MYNREAGDEVLFIHNKEIKIANIDTIQSRQCGKTYKMYYSDVSFVILPENEVYGCIDDLEQRCKNALDKMIDTYKRRSV